jgi:hypothetical protein
MMFKELSATLAPRTEKPRFRLAMATSAERPARRIVVGEGAGGLEFATRLGARPFGEHMAVGNVIGQLTGRDL